jgi:hypothetical protein
LPCPYAVNYRIIDSPYAVYLDLVFSLACVDFTRHNVGENPL